MHPVFDALDAAIREQQPVAYTALVETRGSTPQKAGATMLVYPDGSQVGTLGGGCVEAEVKRRALHLLDQGQRDILSFQLDGDYGWDDGLICGGRMRMLVDPVPVDSDVSYFDALRDLLARGQGCTEAVVIEAKSDGESAGDRFLLDAEGSVIAARTMKSTAGPFDTAHGGHASSGTSAPARVTEHLKPLASRPRPYVAQGISYLPHLERARLLVVGGGHVGQKVAELAAAVDFDVWVVDDREQYCNHERFPSASRLIVAPFDTALSGLDVGPETFAIIVTRGHNHDEEALYHLAESSARYVGMIGSRRKIKLIFEDLLREGISREVLARVHAPLGYDIGSQTVPEIAISIVAELVAHRNLGGVPATSRPASVLDDIKHETRVNEVDHEPRSHEDTKGSPSL